MLGLRWLCPIGPGVMERSGILANESLRVGQRSSDRLASEQRRCTPAHRPDQQDGRPAPFLPLPVAGEVRSSLTSDIAPALERCTGEHHPCSVLLLGCGAIIPFCLVRSLRYYGVYPRVYGFSDVDRQEQEYIVNIPRRRGQVPRQS